MLIDPSPKAGPGRFNPSSTRLSGQRGDPEQAQELSLRKALSGARLVIYWHTIFLVDRVEE